METLISKLEKEVGLTSEQAVKAVACVQEYMKENDLYIDWTEFMKAKSDKLGNKAKNALNELFGDPTWTDKAAANISDATEKAKQTIKDVRNKAADFIADKD